MGVVLQEVAVHASVGSATVSAQALSACCFHIICMFELVYMNVESDILPHETIISLTLI